jgi:hypothetical protein
MAKTFLLHYKNGEILQLAFPDGYEFHKAIICAPKSADDEKKKVERCIVLSNDVETVEFMDNQLNKQATSL